MELALYALAPLVLFAGWLWWCPLVVHMAGQLSTAGASDGSLALRFWPAGVELQGPSPEYELVVRAFGVVLWRGRPPRSGARDPERQKAKRGWPTARGVRETVTSREGAARIARFLFDQRRQIRLDRLRGTLRVGFEDVEDTGLACGMLHGLCGAFPESMREFSHDADWSGTLCFDACGELRVRAFLGRTAAAGVRLGISLWRARRVQSSREAPADPVAR